MTAKERIEYAQAHQLRELDLSDCGLMEVPEEVFELTQLKTLILGKKYAPNESQASKNQIDFLPFEIGLLNQLEGIGLANNAFTDFPDIITQLPRLQTLMLNDNPLEMLSANVGQLRHLRVLGLGNTQIKELPETIGNLRRLKVLGAANNALNNLPPTIQQLQDLEQLGLANNQFQEFPDVLFGLGSLKVLGMARNQIQTLPRRVLRWQQLKRLDLRDNPMESKIIQAGLRGFQGIQYYFQEQERKRKRAINNIIKGKKAAEERSNLKDRFFKLFNSSATPCAICDGKKTISGSIGHLNLSFNNDRCFGCHGEGVANEDNKEIHLLLMDCNQRKEKCRNKIIAFAEDEQRFTNKIQAQRAASDVLFEETRQSLIDIIHQKRSLLDLRVQQFGFYQRFERKILVGMYNDYLAKVARNEQLNPSSISDGFGDNELGLGGSYSSLYAITKTIEAMIGEQETLFDSLMYETEPITIQDIQERLQALKVELEVLK